MAIAVRELPAEVALPELDTKTVIADELVVDVRQEHIDRGVQENNSMCAIALAAREVLPNWVCVEVSGFGELIINRSHGDHYYAADDAKEFVDRFDHNKRLVGPQRFVFRRVS